MPPKPIPAKKLPNNTPVVWREAMIHAYSHGRTVCELRGGMRITLVQALVYLSNSQWCDLCWGTRPPRLKFRANLG